MRRRALCGIGAVCVLLFSVVIYGQAQDLAERLVSDDQAMRSAALRELDTLDQAAKQQLITTLVSRLGTGRYGRQASEALGRLGPPAVPALVQALHNPDARVVIFAAEALEKMGPAAAPAIPVLVELTVSPDCRVHHDVAKALAATKSPEAVPLLRQALLRTGPPADNDYALFALQWLGPIARDAVPEVSLALQSSNSMTRIIAVKTLVAIDKGDAQFVPVFSKMLSDPEWSVRQKAAGALAELGPAASSAIPQLIAGLNDHLTGDSAAFALGKIGPAAKDAVPALIKQWKDHPSAVQAVGMIGTTAIPALLDGLKNPSPDIRNGCAWQLGEFHAAEAVPQLIAALQDPERTVRFSAAQALKKIGTPEALSAAARFRTETAAKSSQPQQLLSLNEVLAAIPPENGQRNPLQLVHKIDVAGPNGAALLVTVHRIPHRAEARRDRLAIWLKVGTRYRLLKMMESDLDPNEPAVLADRFAQPDGFRYQGEHFIHVMLINAGTQNCHEDTILWIAPDFTLHPVEFVPAPSRYKELRQGEDVRKCEADTFADDEMTFRFGIWNEHDGNCCPTGGEVVGSYKLVGTKRFDSGSKTWPEDFQIVPATFERRTIQR